MPWTRCLVIGVVLVLGCKLDNPAFEGGDELLDDSTGHDSVGESATSDESASSASTSATAETSTSASSAEGTSSSSETAGTSEGNETASTSSSSDGTSSSSSDGTSSSSDTSTDAVDTFDGLDAPIAECPQILVVLTCFDCMTSECCDANTNSYCFTDSACQCMASCLAGGAGEIECDGLCNPSDSEYADALAAWDCAKNSCPLCN